MLNISKKPLNTNVALTSFKAGKRVMYKSHYKFFNWFLLGFAVIIFIILFLPWTQNISGRGFVTTLTPDQRPQTLQSPIPGRIEEWMVREGELVQKGDTLLRISEVKNEYFDPRLVERTGLQITAKERSVDSYVFKVKTLDQQIAALRQELQLKLEQSRNKKKQAILQVKSDSIDLAAAITNLAIAEKQVDREQQLFNEGIKAQIKVEEKRLKQQKQLAKKVSQEQKLLKSRNEVLNASIEINRVQQNYQEKIAKARSDQASAQSAQADTEAQVSKLETTRSNYEIRTGLYFITAPQNGYINKAIIAGLGETFKEGQELVNIMPSDYDLAVETYVDPIDLPLIHYGEHVRVQFDGWPAIVFSGWPNVSYGTYGATVVAVETFISSNGKYRVLLAPDVDDHEWPDAIRAGSGAYTIALLDDVPIWFELWRHLNGFPPNYYQPEDGADKGKKKK